MYIRKAREVEGNRNIKKTVIPFTGFIGCRDPRMRYKIRIKTKEKMKGKVYYLNAEECVN